MAVAIESADIFYILGNICGGGGDFAARGTNITGQPNRDAINNNVNFFLSIGN
jgi:hypothetical protein